MSLIKLLRHIILICLLGTSCLYYVHAQDDTMEESKDAPNSSPNDGKKSFLRKHHLDISGGYKILLPGQMPDSVPLRSTQSGTIFFHFGLQFEIAPLVDFRIKPGFSFSTLDFREDSSKTFPTPGQKVFEFEKLRTTSVEVPVGFRFNFARNSKGKGAVTFEVGAAAGVVISSSYKLRTVSPTGQKSHNKIWPVDGISQLNYGLYSDIRYKNIGIHVSYKLSDFFDDAGTYLTGDPDKNFGQPIVDDLGKGIFPSIGPIQIGIILGF